MPMVGFSLLKQPAVGGGSLGHETITEILNTSDTLSSYTSSSFGAAAGSNRCVYFIVEGRVASGSTVPTSLVWNSQSATLVASNDNTPAYSTIAIYRVLEANIPAAGTVVLTLPNDWVCCAIQALQFNNVDQTTPDGTATVGNDSFSVSVTMGATSSYQVTVVGQGGGAGDASVNLTGQTILIASGTGTAGSSDTRYAVAVETGVTGANAHDFTWSGGGSTSIDVGIGFEVFEA